MTILNPFFGKYGGQYVPEVLLPALNQLEKTFVEARNDPCLLYTSDAADE